VQVPPEQVPDGAYVASVTPSRHAAPGGVSQTTPLQGSLPVHAPFAHEVAQTVSDDG
jgi:hypothetical protein